jgi:hypothetical protein
MPTATRRSLLPPQAPSSEHSRRKGKRRRGRRSIKAGEETSVEATGTRISEDEAKETTTTKREDEEVVSSAPSSPIYDDPDPSSELIKAWERAQRNADIEKGNFLTASPPLSRFLRILEIYRSIFFIFFFDRASSSSCRPP